MPNGVRAHRSPRQRVDQAEGAGHQGLVQSVDGRCCVTRPAGFDAAMAKLNSFKRAPTDGRPQLVDLGMPVFTDRAPPPQQGPGGPGYRP